ncbi:MAG: polysaccharide export protein, partial [Sulfurovum sp.]
MKKNRLILILLFLATKIWAVDVAIQQLNSDKSQLIDSSKAYFGEEIFKGNFKENQQFRYNPNYILNVGDVISVKMWGAYEFSSELSIDKQGNIFIPKVG